MNRDKDFVSLRHMLDHANEAIEMLHGVSLEDLNRNRRLGLALVKVVEIIGEAARRISETKRRQHP